MEQELLSYLRSPQTIREVSRQFYRLAQADQLRHFKLHEELIPQAATFVANLIEEQYPNFDIPFHSRWRHFEGPSPSPAEVFNKLTTQMDRQQRARTAFDLVIISVLLDAGAGKTWKYLWKGDGKSYARSEGLAVSSFQMFVDGLFSATPEQPLQVDAKRLAGLSIQDISAGMQVSLANPLDGLNGRVDLLHRLAKVMLAKPEIFEKDGITRIGHLFDHLACSTKGEKIAAPKVLQTILEVFEDIWPGRISRSEHNLGDVWEHPAAKGTLPGSEGLVPFHKLSQWLTYSLLEPLADAGFKIHEVDGLTGLAEYRNGGFFLDAAVITPRDPEILVTTHAASSHIIVEWRALTICLLDELTAALRQRWQLDALALPMVKVLEGGTWKAGRLLASQKRQGGSPPLNIVSDGTVF